MAAISLALDAFISQHKMYTINYRNSAVTRDTDTVLKRIWMDTVLKFYKIKALPNLLYIYEIWINDTTAKMDRNLRNETVKNIRRLHMLRSSV